MPHMQYVSARRNVCDQDFSARIRHAIEWRVQRDDDCAHFRMNVAEDVGNTRAVEHHIARRTGFVKTEVEAFPLEKRENVVKERISVGEFHGGSHRHDQEMRLKVFVVLRQSQSTRRAHHGSRRSNPSARSAWRIRKPNHCVRSVRHAGIRAAVPQLHSYCNVNSLRGGRNVTDWEDTHQERASPVFLRNGRHRRPSESIQAQNKTPIIRLTWSAAWLVPLA